MRTALALLSVFLALPTARADDVVPLRQGEIAPFTGVLYPPGRVREDLERKERVKILRLELELAATDLDMAESTCDTEMDALDRLLTAEREGRAADRAAIRDVVVAPAPTPAWQHPLAIVGYVAAGVGVGVLVGMVID